MKRDSSGEFDQHGESEESDSDRALDLAALRRSRLQNPGKISMFGSISGRKIDDDDDLASAEKVKKLFDLPSTEKIITGVYAFCVYSDSRISRLVSKECYDTRIHASHRATHLFLCPTS